MTSSDEEAEELAAQVEEYNLERRRATEKAYERALKKSQENNAHILILGDEDFFPGISGLVASHLVKAFYRPAVVMALDGEVVRARGRSIFDLVGALYQCQDLFQSFGGHPMTAGFVMPLSNLPCLEERLTNIAARDLGGLDLQPVLNIDAEALPHQLMGETFQRLNDLEPFGAGNPCPVFLGRGLRLVKTWTMGNRGQHLRFKVHDGRATWDATAVRQGNGEVPQAQRLDLAYSLTTRSWRKKRTLNLNVVDFQSSETGT
jgi:single-stranded-DNA-specific exonuclease